MYSYICGKVVEITKTYIVLENNNIGYLIYCSNPYLHQLNENIKIYLYQQIKDDEHSLFGFKTKEERELFLKLISVKGIGAKTALPMLTSGKTSEIINSIETENITYLKKFPKIGDKIARQIILDLKGKLVSQEDVPSNELIEALQALGYKKNIINKTIKNIDKTKKLEEQVKEALKFLSK